MKKTIALTYGDSQGIGPEILNKTLKDQEIVETLKTKQIFLKIFGRAKLVLVPEKIKDLVSVNYFQEIYQNKKISEESFNNLLSATKVCLKKKALGLVTGPISKTKWLKNKINFAGQTEFLNSFSKEFSKPKAQVSAEMCFLAENQASKLRISLITRHISLKEVPKQITEKRLQEVVKTSESFLQNLINKKNPSIGLIALNPHNGENGNLGQEELIWQDWLKNKFFKNLRGPFSPDYILVKAAKDHLKGLKQDFDLYLSPYHDQVLPLIKVISNLQAVNVTIGLAFIRTSPDHGTAFEIAGKNLADYLPFKSALKTCIELCKL